jgi:hypothetical protein
VDFETNLQQDLMYKGYTPYSPKQEQDFSHEVNQPGSYVQILVVAQKAIEATLPTAWLT